MKAIVIFWRLSNILQPGHGEACLTVKLRRREYSLKLELSVISLYNIRGITDPAKLYSLTARIDDSTHSKFAIFSARDSNGEARLTVRASPDYQHVHV